MQMNRTFHQTGVEWQAREIVPRTFYPGPPVRGVTIMPIAFWPNPLPDFMRIKYSTTVA